MRSQLRRALEAGAFGLSTGLIYPPGVFSEVEELVALAEVLPSGRVYSTHMRGEGPQLLQSVAEAVQIAERAGCRLQVSHLKATGKQSWGTVSHALEALDAARARGLVAHQDVYPYEAASTMLTACLPPWFQDGGNQAFLARLRSEDALARAEAELERHDGSWENWVAAAGWDRIVVASSATHRYDGMSLAHIASQKGIPAFDALVGVLLQEELQVSMTVFAMDEKDITAAIAHPSSMIGSDGLPPGTGGKPHPRMFGTFPRILATYVRDTRLLSLPEAIRKMTHLPATAFGIPDRGLVAEEYAADLVLFDAETVKDHATYEAPDRRAGGIRTVMVNGRIVMEDGEFSGERAGRRLTPV
jgi:N-acyl-D-aspartate/D-glutamate deacylase